MNTVTIHHPDTGQEAVVFEIALPHHEQRGWKRGPNPANVEQPAAVGEPRKLTQSQPSPVSKPTTEKVS